MECLTVTDYVTACAKDLKLAGIPISMVAEFLEISQSAVVQRIKSEKFSNVKVAGTRLVLMTELIDLWRKDESDVSDLTAYLIDLVKSGKAPTTYEPVMQSLRLDHKKSADRMRIGTLLGRASRVTDEKDGVLISVIVQRKDTEMPSEFGFFGLVDDRRPNWNKELSKEEFVAKELKKVLKKYR